MDQEPYQGFDIPSEEFADNPDPRVPCVLLLDVSYSMSGQPIAELNSGLQQYREELLTDNLAARRVEVALFTFGGEVRLERDFVTARGFDPPMLSPNGHTPMAEAIIRGIKHLEDRKATYQSHGIAYYRPWVFLITDGAPTDQDSDWRLACEAVRRGEEEKKFTFFAVGTKDADFDKLREVSSARAPLGLKGLMFRELFRWLSNSQTRVSQSQVGEHIALPPATGEGGWAAVPA
ncbi:MAG: VWA domain-containing protein [Gemmatimonadales bacterium]